MQIRICPTCGSEYQLHVMACLDCGGATVVWEEGKPLPSGEVDLPAEQKPAVAQIFGLDNASAALPQETPSELFEESGYRVLRQADLGWIEALAQRLQAKGVHYEIASVPGGHGDRYVLAVSEANYETAAAVDWEYFSQSVPEAAAVKATENACPACGFTLAEGVTECPECGLVMG